MPFNNLHANFISIFSNYWLIEPQYAEAQLLLFWESLKNVQAIEQKRDPDRRYYETTNYLEKGKTVAVSYLTGAVTKYDQFCGPDGTQSLMSELSRIEHNPMYHGVILRIDSGGGEALAAGQLVDRIEKFAKSKLIWAFVDSMACSAAQWIAAPCHKTWASTNMDILGSIGVMTSFANMKPYFEKQGIEFHEIYSKLSPDKNADFQAALQKNYEPIQQTMLDPLADNFRQSMKKFRPNLSEDTLTGKTYFAQEALKNGLIDQIGSFDECLEAFFETL